MPRISEINCIMSPSAINECTSFLHENLLNFNVEPKTAASMSTAYNLLFLSWLDKTSEGEIELRIVKHFRTIKITAELPGNRLISPTEQKAAGIYGRGRLGRLFQNNVEYTYVHDINRGHSEIKGTPMNPYVKNAVAIVLAIVLGLVLINLGIQETILENYVTPVFDSILSILKLFIGVVVFLSITDGILMIGDIHKLKDTGKKALFDFERNSLFMAVLTFGFALLFFQTGGTTDSLEKESQTIITILVSFVPTDIVSPFSSGNVLQILFIALFVGVIMLSMKNKLVVLPAVINDLQNVFMHIMSVIGGVMPLFVFFSVLKIMLGGNFEALRTAAFAFGAFALVGCINLAVNLERTTALSNIKITSLAKKIAGNIMLGIVTSSSTISFPKNMECCCEKLNVRESNAHFVLPLGSIFYRPAIIPMLVFACLMSANSQGMLFSVVDMALLVMTAMIMSVALPPVAGGAISCFVLMFSQFNIPSSGIAILVSLNIFFGALQAGLDNGSLLLRMCAFDHKLQNAKTM